MIQIWHYVRKSFFQIIFSQPDPFLHFVNFEQKIQADKNDSNAKQKRVYVKTDRFLFSEKFLNLKFSSNEKKIHIFKVEIVCTSDHNS